MTAYVVVVDIGKYEDKDRAIDCVCLSSKDANDRRIELEGKRYYMELCDASSEEEMSEWEKETFEITAVNVEPFEIREGKGNGSMDCG